MIGHSRTLQSARLKDRRRKIIIGKIALGIIGGVSLWSLIFWASSLPSVTIERIEVEGTVSLSKEAIASSTREFLLGRYFFTVPRGSIFFYPKVTIRENLQATYPEVEHISLGAKNFYTLGIIVKERTAAGLWCRGAFEDIRKDNEDCFLLDKTGFIFAPVAGTADTSTLIRFYSKLAESNPIGQSYAPKAYFSSLLAFARELNDAGFVVKAFHDRQDDAVEALLSEGQRLVFTRDIDFVAALGNFKTVIGDPSFGGSAGFVKTDYIDLRFGNKVFYKLK